MKPYWNDELDRLKADSIFWHNLWIDAGRPASGTIQRIKMSCKFKYKLAIRDAYVTFESGHDDEIYKHFLNKKPNEFWKSWQAKFRKNINSQVSFAGCNSNTDVANAFAGQFHKTFYDSRCDSEAVDNFRCDHKSKLSDRQLTGVSVELIDSCIRELHTGKACGPDNLSAEHLRNAHPSLIIHLQQLFHLIYAHGFVPDNFGAGII